MTAEEKHAQLEVRGNNVLDYQEIIALLLKRNQALEAEVHRQPYDDVVVDQARIDELNRS